jgi:hypothetical protein
MMMVRPVARFQKRLNDVGLAGRMAFDFAALADALVRLDMRAGRYFLQKNLDRLRTFDAFESEYAGRFHNCPRSVGGAAGAAKGAILSLAEGVRQRKSLSAR